MYGEPAFWNWKQWLCWHRYRIAHGMYDDLAVDCIKCEATHFSCKAELVLLKLLGKLPDTSWNDIRIA